LSLSGALSLVSTRVVSHGSSELPLLLLLDLLLL
jgi:hypothetical protein